MVGGLYQDYLVLMTLSAASEARAGSPEKQTSGVLMETQLEMAFLGVTRTCCVPSGWLAFPQYLHHLNCLIIPSHF